LRCDFETGQRRLGQRAERRARRNGAYWTETVQCIGFEARSDDCIANGRPKNTRIPRQNSSIVKREQRLSSPFACP
jgi:hypothetical protein